MIALILCSIKSESICSPCFCGDQVDHKMSSCLHKKCLPTKFIFLKKIYGRKWLCVKIQYLIGVSCWIIKQMTKTKLKKFLEKGFTRNNWAPGVYITTVNELFEVCNKGGLLLLSDWACVREHKKISKGRAHQNVYISAIERHFW